MNCTNEYELINDDNFDKFNISQLLLINLLNDNKIQINESRAVSLLEKYKDELTSELAYKLYQIEVVRSQHSKALIKKIVLKKEYSLKFLQNHNRSYSQLNKDEQSIVIESFIVHNLNIKDTKQYIYEDILDFIRTKKKLTDLIQSDSLLPYVERSIGIELEFLSKKDVKYYTTRFNLNDLINDKDKDESHYKDNLWDVKEDDSIEVSESHKHPLEFVSPIIYPQNKKSNFDFMSKIMNDPHLIINQSCGLHIHVDVSDMYNVDEYIKDCIKTDFYHWQSIIYFFCDESRQDNPYCPKYIINSRGVIEEKKYSKILSQYRAGINLFTGLNTIEFRMKEAVMSPIEIERWAEFCQRITSFIINKQFHPNIKNEYLSLKEYISKYNKLCKKDPEMLDIFFLQIEKTYFNSPI